MNKNSFYFLHYLYLKNKDYFRCSYYYYKYLDLFLNLYLQLYYNQYYFINFFIIYQFNHD